MTAVLGGIGRSVLRLDSASRNEPSLRRRARRVAVQSFSPRSTARIEALSEVGRIIRFFAVRMIRDRGARADQRNELTENLLGPLLRDAQASRIQTAP